MKARNYTVTVLLIVYLVSAISCSPQQRLQRLIKKNPELLQLDTIRIIDTVIIESYNYDTLTIPLSYKLKRWCISNLLGGNSTRQSF